MISRKEAKAILKEFPGLKFAMLSPCSTDVERSFTAQLHVCETRVFNDKEHTLVGHFNLTLPDFVPGDNDKQNNNLDFELTHLAWQHEYVRGSEEWEYAFENKLPTYETVVFDSTLNSDQQLSYYFESLYFNEETVAQIMMCVGVKIEKDNRIVLPPKIKF